MTEEEVARAERDLTLGEREVLAADRKLWEERLGAGAHLDEWLALGPGMMIRRRLAMKMAFTNQPEGKTYVEAFSAFMLKDGFYRHLKGLSVKEKKEENVTRKTISAVMWLHDSPERMTILRETRDAMSLGERARLNSPIRARQRVEEVIKARQGGTEARLTTSPLAMLKGKVADLERQLAAANEKLAHREDGSLFDLKHDTVSEIAKVIVANITDNRASNLSKEIAEELKRKKQRPAG